MKRFDLLPKITLLVWIAIVAQGCQKAGPVEPADGSTKQAPAFIKLPKNNALHKIISVTKTIYAQSGGELKLNYDYGEGAKKVNIDVSLKFEPGSVSRDVDITLSVDDAVLMTTIDLSFAPEGLVFLKPAILDVNAQGLDLSGIPPGANINLYYFNKQTGTWEQIPTRRISVNISNGQLQCKDGEIPHFSRYAFGY